jgi:multidrug transporter EmrE-like cation transporter
MIAFGAAAISGISYLLQLTGAKELPATVLYPMVTGGCIIFSALSGRIFFKEKLSTYQLVSIGLCFVGTLLFL